MASAGTKYGERADDPNMIRIRVENVKDLDKIGKSEVKRIDGIPWRLTAYRYEDSLVTEIHCLKSKECAIWEHEVKAKVDLINHSHRSRSIHKRYEEILHFEEEAIHTELISWNDLLGKDGFVVNGYIVIEAAIGVKGSKGKRTRSAIDFFSPSVYSDVVLIVEGHKFHVSRQILAHASSYFKALFYGNFKESQEDEIEIQDISADKFVTVLHFIYDSVTDMNDDNVEDLLRMARVYDIPKITDEAEKWLINSNCVPLHKQLLLANEYELEVAKARFLVDIDTFDDLKDIKKSESYKFYSVELMDEIFERMLEIHDKEVEEREEEEDDEE